MESRVEKTPGARQARPYCGVGGAIHGLAGCGSRRELPAHTARGIRTPALVGGHGRLRGRDPLGFRTTRASSSDARHAARPIAGLSEQGTFSGVHRIARLEVSPASNPADPDEHARRLPQFTYGRTDGSRKRARCAPTEKA